FAVVTLASASFAVLTAPLAIVSVPPLSVASPPMLEKPRALPAWLTCRNWSPVPMIDEAVAAAASWVAKTAAPADRADCCRPKEPGCSCADDSPARAVMVGKHMERATSGNRRAPSVGGRVADPGEHALNLRCGQT